MNILKLCIPELKISRQDRNIILFVNKTELLGMFDASTRTTFIRGHYQRNKYFRKTTNATYSSILLWLIGSMDSVFECIRIYTQIRYRDLLNNIIHFQAMDVLFQINKPNYISRKIVINIDIQVEKQRDVSHNWYDIVLIKWDIKFYLHVKSRNRNIRGYGTNYEVDKINLISIKNK